MRRYNYRMRGSTNDTLLNAYFEVYSEFLWRKYEFHPTHIENLRGTIAVCFDYFLMRSFLFNKRLIFGENVWELGFILLCGNNSIFWLFCCKKGYFFWNKMWNCWWSPVDPCRFLNTLNLLSFCSFRWFHNSHVWNTFIIQPTVVLKYGNWKKFITPKIDNFSSTLFSNE